MHDSLPQYRVWLQHHVIFVQESRTRQCRQGSRAISHRPWPHESRWNRQDPQERESWQNCDGRGEGAGGEDGRYLCAESQWYVDHTPFPFFPNIITLHLQTQTSTSHVSQLMLIHTLIYTFRRSLPHPRPNGAHLSHRPFLPYYTQPP